MKNRFLILCLVLATLFACNSDSMGIDGLDETAEKRSGVPFKAKKIVGTYEVGLPPNGNGECGPLPSLTATGLGTISHLGKSSIIEKWCFDGDPGFEYGRRTITLTAANGDIISGEVEVISYDLETRVLIEKVTNLSGDGRFANVEGEFTQTIVIGPEEPAGSGKGQFTYSAEGTISY